MLESVDGSQERVVLISSSTVAEGEWAPAQLALFRVHSCIVDVEGDSSSARVEVRGSRLNQRYATDLHMSSVCWPQSDLIAAVSSM